MRSAARGCQAELPATAKFCFECGTPVAQGQGASRAAALPSADADVARPGEGRELTVLFCDLLGSTSLAQELDAEDWRDVLVQYHSRGDWPKSASAAELG